MLGVGQHGGAGAADGDCDDGEGEGQKEDVAGEDDPFGAGDDGGLKEGMHAVDECAGGSDAEGVKRRPRAALREEAQTDEENQVGGEGPGDGAPVPLQRREHDGCAEEECGDGQDPGWRNWARASGAGMAAGSGEWDEESSGDESNDDESRDEKLRVGGAERVVVQLVVGVEGAAGGEEDGSDG